MTRRKEARRVFMKNVGKLPIARVPTLTTCILPVRKPVQLFVARTSKPATGPLMKVPPRLLFGCLIASALLPSCGAAEGDALAILANIQARHLPYGAILDPIF